MELGNDSLINSMKTLIAILAVLSFTALAAGNETVTWDNNDPADQVTGYRVYWSTNSSAPKPWPVIATVTTNSAPGAAIINNVRNYYYVTAVNASGESDPSDVAFRPGPPIKVSVKK